VNQAETVVPPSEAFKPAGPSAEKDLDYETIYGPGALPPGSTIALNAPSNVAGQPQAQTPPAAAAPSAAEDKSGEQKAQPPKAKVHEIRAVAVVPVTGAPGNGNAELTAAMQRTLRSAGWPVVGTPREDALTIKGTVALSPANGQSQRVALNWSVATYKGMVLGTIKQANSVPAGSLDKSWGQAADYATEAGATGIFDLIKKYR
jgi:hypothetical protein